MADNIKTRAAAKLPGADTGIEIKHTICDICTPGPHCGIDAYVKNRTVIKVEGTPGFPGSDGKLCTKGASNRQYLYRPDRIQTPMRRVGPKGSGQFEPISWDEAISETAQNLQRLKSDSGAPSVVWACGYTKWFRPFLQRLCYSFGSPNYFTESSACNSSGLMAQVATFGCPVMPDLARADTALCWGSNAPVSSYGLGNALIRLKERGGHIVVVDPRYTQTAQKYADLYIRPAIGTDTLLANAVARILWARGALDQEYLARNCYGLEEYFQLLSKTDLTQAQRVTRVSLSQMEELADILSESGPAALLTGTSLGHRTNGFNIYRSLFCLMAVTGNFDRPGTLLPSFSTFAYSEGGFNSLERQFEQEFRPKDVLPIGAERFPLWYRIMGEAQGMAFTEQARTGSPYPIRGGVFFGANHMMYPQSKKFLETLRSLDFVAASDIFWTDVCRCADIVFPASTSFERSEVKCYGSSMVVCTQPVIPPVWDNKDDVEIMSLLSRALGLDDPLLNGGYQACIEYIFSKSGITDWTAVQNSPLPVRIPNARPYIPGDTLAKGCLTPSGKIELSSGLISSLGRKELSPLPVWQDALTDDASPLYPFVMMSGARLPNAIHSRLHDLSWPKSLRPDPMVDIHPEDAAALGILQGDDVEVFTALGSIRLKANLTCLCNAGDLHCYHGYREANINDLIPDDLLDPYTGFPTYKHFRCGIRKWEVEAE